MIALGATANQERGVQEEQYASRNEVHRGRRDASRVSIPSTKAHTPYYKNEKAAKEIGRADGDAPHRKG